VKVRFRGAANSDDVFDFQVFLSPADVWAAMISKDVATGKAKLTTSDVSCTKPTNVNATFSTVRLDPSLTGDAAANGTREGYIEIISMADIPKTNTVYNVIQTSSTDTANPLYTAIKHVKGVAPCTGSAFTALDSASGSTTTMARLTNAQATLTANNTVGTAGTAAAYGLIPSTGGLMANWSIINTVSQAAWSGEAYAFGENSAKGVPGSGMLVNYFPQTATALSAAEASLYTADPLFLSGSAVYTYNKTSQALAFVPTTVAAATTPARYDLPDVSTPFDPTHEATADVTLNAVAYKAAPTTAMMAFQSVLGKASVVAEFATESAINGSTDWQFSMPTRRYAVAMAYNKISSTDDGRRFNGIYQESANLATNAFNVLNTSVTTNNIICVNGSSPKAYDREENTATSGVVLSPQVLGQVAFCGEASILAWNNGQVSSAIKGNITVYPIDVSPFTSGWAKMTTTTKASDNSTTVNLPFVGGAFMKATNGVQGYGVYQYYR